MQHHRNAKPLMKPVRYILIFACFVPLFLFRDFTPNNELKYLSIADEALRDGHLFTFWNHGTVYADKPPLYLWIVMLGKWLWGTHNLFFLSLFSIIPALWIVYIMNKWTAGNLSGKIQKSGSYMLMTSGLFTGAAIVLRMDMLMCLFIVLALYTFYKLYTGMAKTRDRFLLPLYIFLAVFSKGPVGFIVPLCSIVTFLLVKKEIRHFTRYMSWKQWCLLLGLCFLWFGAVYAEGGKSYLNNLLFHQTINRAIDSFHHQAPFWYYFTTIWYSLAPWTLFYIVVILLGLKRKQSKPIWKNYSSLPSGPLFYCYPCSAVNWTFTCSPSSRLSPICRFSYTPMSPTNTYISRFSFRQLLSPWLFPVFSSPHTTSISRSPIISRYISPP